ncbi:hypothetical protein L1887_36173 [Cichorium endivia]|nr:hypothetical protein L1887_36173 [Cichorium endivia]
MVAMTSPPPPPPPPPPCFISSSCWTHESLETLRVGNLDLLHFRLTSIFDTSKKLFPDRNHSKGRFHSRFF